MGLTQLRLAAQELVAPKNQIEKDYNAILAKMVHAEVDRQKMVEVLCSIAQSMDVFSKRLERVETLLGVTDLAAPATTSLADTVHDAPPLSHTSPNGTVTTGAMGQEILAYLKMAGRPAKPAVIAVKIGREASSFFYACLKSLVNAGALFKADGLYSLTDEGRLAIK